MRNYSLWALALIVGGSAAEMVKTEMTMTTTSNAPQNIASNQEISSAAFRDGSYLGKLAAERGDAPHMAVGRWAKNADRILFATGYSEAYSQNLTASAVARGNQADVAAYRDGLYLGKLDSQRGSARHVAIGRWSGASDRVSFAKGYDQAYQDGYSATAAQGKSLNQASLVH
jgi:hypothetical protein